MSMSWTTIDKQVKNFLKQIFCVVGANSPYQNSDFAHLLIDAAEHQDFLTNTAKRVGGPTGETMFSRLKGTDIRYIQHLLGHSRLSTIQIYTHVSKRNIAGNKSPIDI